MNHHYAQKSTVDEIRERFDHDVERFSNLETGQQAAPDSPLCMDLVTDAAARVTPNARRVLDIGCGAGNYTLNLLQRLPGLNVTLLDLSRPMLDRAEQRASAAGASRVEVMQGDVRDLDLGAERYDVVLTAAALHHLRTDDEWEAVFKKVYASLRPGGCFWIVDLIEQASTEVQAMTWARYGEFLVELKDEAYRDQVFTYVEEEDTPRPLMYQLDLLRRVGFQDVDVLHKRLCGAAFGGVKAD